MNGQAYHPSGTSSANGTPTPSSTSYPASLSSHSSRDPSPSRGPLPTSPHNHIPTSNPNQYNNYKAHLVNSNSVKSYAYQNHSEDNYVGRYGNSQEPRVPSMANSSPKIMGSPYQEYSRGGLGQGAEGLAERLRPGQPPSQGPPSSGPPRTNALGIIPYSTEPAASTAAARVGGQPGYPYRPSRPYHPPPSQPPQPQQGYRAPYYGYGGPAEDLAGPMAGLSVTQGGYSKLWGQECLDLLRTRDLLPPGRLEPPPIRLPHEFSESVNVSPDLFRCTLTKVPETKSLLDKCRLPFGVLIHPFKDLNQLSVIQCSIIVRCRSCRTYINPFVYFVDTKHWKCNLCYRVNDLPDEFQYDPLTKSFGDPTRRPEIKSATIEFIAPSEYMVRPPQPAAYVFVLEVSRLALESGYLPVFCETLLAQLPYLPGDRRTSIAFITFDSSVHFYSLSDTFGPHQLVVLDIEDMFIPSPDNLLVNLKECDTGVRDLLKELPSMYREGSSYESGSALGAALQAAYKLVAATGGRVSVFQCSLPSCGPGKLAAREDPNQRTSEHVPASLLNPVTDFYKKLALDCSAQQVAVDLFLLNSQYVDLASLSGVSMFSGGSLYHLPMFTAKSPEHVEALQATLQRYLSRKIGFESVMRLRCTRGLSIHTFHGNFFVRSTDLLSLPNVNPDAGFGMQVSIDENLTDVQNVCFQAALLYTSSSGERKIRVHTLCLPIAANLSDVLHSADQQAIAGLLAKLAVDRCLQSSVGDAREAFLNVVADVLSAYRVTQSSANSACLMVPFNLRLLPLYVLALLKHTAFRVGLSTRLDDRLFSMVQMKSLPLCQLMQAIHPDLYPVHNLADYRETNVGEEVVPLPPRLHLSAERIDSDGVYLLDDGQSLIVYVGHNILPSMAASLLGAPSFALLPPVSPLLEVDTLDNERLRRFVNYLQNDKPVMPTVTVVRDDSPERGRFLSRLVEDRTEAGPSYYEFLQRVKQLIK